MHREPKSRGLFAAAVSASFLGLLGQVVYRDAALHAVAILVSAAGLAVVAVMLPAPRPRTHRRRRRR